MNPFADAIDPLFGSGVVFELGVADPDSVVTQAGVELDGFDKR